ncbi:PadR family transcriptional regulator [Tistrella mobilis]|uniref:PadR family transcriptional regulator n=1 Tax=Tistrella mobilis TaxID=171437 RepID=UPI00355901D2
MRFGHRQCDRRGRGFHGEGRHGHESDGFDIGFGHDIGHREFGSGHGGGHGWGRGFGRGFGRGRSGEDWMSERGGRRRFFDAGQLRLVLLKLISMQPRHGYDLIRAVEELTGGVYVPSPGVVYPALSMLEDMNQVAGTEAEGGRKVFAITADGEAELAANAAMVTELMARLAAMAEMRERVDTTPVERAIGNLKMALRGRLTAPDADRKLALEIARILDEATQKIERS